MKTIIVSLLIASLLVYPNVSSAQFDNGIGNGEESGIGSGNSIWDGEQDIQDSRGLTPTDAPFDGGVIALLVAGAAYGAKRVKRRVTSQAINFQGK